MIVINIIGLLLVIAMPNIIRARAQVQAKTCSKNLLVIDRAKQQWALDNRIANTNATVPTLDAIAGTGLVGPSGYIKATPTCPTTGSVAAYSVGNINAEPTCINNNPPLYKHIDTGM